LHALIAGGNWNNGVHDGSRAVNANNYPWNVNTNIGCRGVSDYKPCVTAASMRHAARIIYSYSQTAVKNENIGLHIFVSCPGYRAKIKRRRRQVPQGKGGTGKYINGHLQKFDAGNMHISKR
jgi:hypothetical protein